MAHGHRYKVATSCFAVLALVGGTTASAGATADAAKPKGEPITIGVIVTVDEASGQSNVQVVKALKAAIKAADAEGGVAARPVKVKVCTTKNNDPNGGVSCANEMVDDPAVVAVVGSANGEGDAIMPIFEQAGIAAIGGLPISTSDFSSPIAFPVMSGSLGTPGAATLLYDEFGIDKISVGLLDLAAAATVPILIDNGLATRGTELAGQVSLPLDKQDFSAEAAQLADLGDGIVVASLPDMFGRLERAGRSTGSWEGKKIATLPSVLTPEILKSLGDDAIGIYIATGGFATNNIKKPGVKAYLSAMKKYGDASTSQDDLVKNAWLAFQVFTAAVEDLPTIDRASILESMGQLQFDSQGFAPPLDFTTPNTTVFGGAVPRAFNTSVMYAVVKAGGKIVSIKPDFVNPFEAP